MANASCLQALLLAILLISHDVQAVTKRHAKVRVRNEFGETIYGVKVIHKYSNNYVDQFQWGYVRNGRTSSNKGYARYHTGVLTTGRDWWKVIWVTKYATYTTHPNNFRDIIDFLEETWDKIDTAVILAASAAVSAATAGAASPVAAAVAASALTSSAIAASNGITARGKTVGFKQHILRKSDQNRPVTITIRRNKVIISSRSGTSTTNGIKRKRLPISRPVRLNSMPKPSSGRIRWQRGNWAFACDFRGNDIYNRRMRGKHCGPACARDRRCTHFTWTNHRGGTCWMKGGRASKSRAFFTNKRSMVCGVTG